MEIRPGVPTRTDRETADKINKTRLWWHAVSPDLMLRAGGSTTSIPCEQAIAELKGVDQYAYHDFTTEYANSENDAYVDFVSLAFNFGMFVPVTYTKNGSIYSFKGQIPMCTESGVCKNGKQRVHQIYVTGEIDMSPVPDVMKYTYQMDVFCGGVLTCKESGSFVGERTTGDEDTLKGNFTGKQSWELRCCSSRHQL